MPLSLFRSMCFGLKKGKNCLTNSTKHCFYNHLVQSNVYTVQVSFITNNTYGFRFENTFSGSLGAEFDLSGVPVSYEGEEIYRCLTCRDYFRLFRNQVFYSFKENAHPTCTVQCWLIIFYLSAPIVDVRKWLILNFISIYIFVICPV